MKALFKSLWNGIITLIKYIFILPFYLAFLFLKELGQEVGKWFALILIIPFIIISLLLKGINKLLILMDSKPIPIPKWLQFENDDNKEKHTNLKGDEDGKQQ